MSTPTTNKVITENTMTPEQKAVLNTAMPFVNQYAANPPTTFQGNTVAPKSPQEIAAENARLGSGQVAANLAGSQVAANQQLLNPNNLNVNSNPYFQAATQAAINPLIQNFQESIMPSIRGNAIAAGGLGGSRQGVAEGIAARGLGQTIADTTSKMSMQQYNTGLDTLGKGLIAAPSTQQATTAGADQLDIVAGRDRQLNQAIMDENLRKFMEERALPIDTAKNIMSIMGFGQGNTTTTSPTPKGPSLGQNILGGMAAGGAIGGMMPDSWVNSGAWGAGLGGMAGLFF